MNSYCQSTSLSSKKSRFFKRRYPLVWMLLIMSLVLSGCQTCPAPANTVLIGHPEHTERAANFLSVRGLKVQQNTRLGSRDAVLFVASAASGPFPQTAEQIAAIQGQPHAQAAIFLLDVGLVNDQELLQLVVLEMKELLELYGQPSVSSMPILHDDDPNVFFIIRGLLP